MTTAVAGGQVLQREEHRVVTLEEGGTVVRKTFVGPEPAPLLALARHEYDRLAGFSEGLVPVVGAACPRPIELCSDGHPAIRMTRGEGSPLAPYLRRPLDDAESQTIIGVLRRALTTYIITFGEPYFDFHFRNMLYDPVARQVTFLDLGVPDHLVPARHTLDKLSPVDVSLGNLLGSCLFERARPRNLYRLRQNRRTLAMATAVLEAVVSAPSGDDAVTHNRALRSSDLVATEEGLEQAVEVVFRQSVSWGPPSHRLWYRPFRPLLARGRRVVRGAFSGRAAAGDVPPTPPARLGRT